MNSAWVRMPSLACSANTCDLPFHSDPRKAGNIVRASSVSGTSTPANSKIAGPMSICWHRASIARPPSKRPGDQTIIGTCVIWSYIVHFWLCPWSVRQSP